MALKLRIALKNGALTCYKQASRESYIEKMKQMKNEKFKYPDYAPLQITLSSNEM